METEDDRTLLLKAVDAFGDVFAVVTAQHKILAAGKPHELPQPKAVIGQDCYRIFYGRETPCDSCGLAEALAHGRAVIRPRTEAPATAGLQSCNYIYPLPEGAGGPAGVCTALTLPEPGPSARSSDLSRAFLMNLIHNAADGVIAADRHGRIRIYNRAAEQMFGYTAKEALAGFDIRRLYSPDGAYEIMANLRSEDHGGRGRLIGYALDALAKNGETVPIKLNAAIVYENNQEVATIGFFQDQREMLRLRQALAEQMVAPLPDGASPSLGDLIDGLNQAFGRYDIKFGDAAVRSGLASAAQVENALAKQREIEEKTDIHVSIGHVMIQLGIIDENQRDRLLGRLPSGGDPVPLEAIAEPTDDTARAEPSGDIDPVPASDKGDAAAGAVRLVVSEDRLEALLHRGSEGAAVVSLEAVATQLAAAGIVHGLVDRAAIARFLQSDPPAAQPLIIARGIAPQPGLPPEIRFHFETDALCIGTVRDDGTTDWKNRGPLPQVKAGDLLCTVIPGTAGIPGTDVFGQPVPVALPAPLPRCGAGVEISADGRQYRATGDGLATWTADGVLAVSPTLHIGGDVGMETGHIDFNGHVEIEGAIQKGFHVYGHSLRAESLFGAEVHVAGDMVVQRGIYESQIKCQGPLKAGHVHKSKIEMQEDLIVEREIIESQIETNGRCLAGAASIMASDISAKRGIFAQTIGSEAARPSRLEVGIDHRLKRGLNDIQNQIEVLKKEAKRREDALQAQRRQAEQTAGELGAVAQEQDRYMVQIREIDTALKDPKLRQQLTQTQKMEKKRRYLESKKAQTDVRVEKLLAADEAQSAVLARLDQDLNDARLGLVRLDEEMAQIKESLTNDIGMAVVKASGDVAAGTIVSGPRASLTLPEPRQRVHIFETNAADDEGRRYWRMKTVPLR